MGKLFSRPRNKAEAAKVKRQLRKKYPQMYDKNGNLKEGYAGGFSNAERALRKAGVSSKAMPTDEDRKNKGK